jgi:glucose-1-phosphate cytidylyltransferase
MDAVILCGGRGTRLGGGLPKSLTPIGPKPILWHLVHNLASQGVTRVWLATGYRGAEVAKFARAEEWPRGLVVNAIDTGEDTATGGRLLQFRTRVDRSFAVVYGDVLADLDLSALSDCHSTHGRLATMTVVRPELPFGVAVLDSAGRVTEFRERPIMRQWINGGFFLIEPAVLDLCTPESTFERGPLEQLAAAGELFSFRHRGFWASLESRKDVARLDRLWGTGAPPW